MNDRVLSFAAGIGGITLLVLAAFSAAADFALAQEEETPLPPVASGGDIDTGAMVIREGTVTNAIPHVTVQLDAERASKDDLGKDEFTFSVTIVTGIEPNEDGTADLGKGKAIIRADAVEWVAYDWTGRLRDVETTRIYLRAGGYLIAYGHHDEINERWARAGKLGNVPATMKSTTKIAPEEETR